jgi:DNA gyrase subunit A
MQLSRLTRLGRGQLEEEMAELRETIAELEAILADDAKLRAGHQGRARRDPRALRHRDAAPRSPRPGDIDIEDLIDDEELVVTMSHRGYIKTVAADAFRTQGRGGRGVAGAKLRTRTTSPHPHTTAHAYLLFFSNRGKVYRLKAHEIPMKDRTARGTAIVNLLQLSPTSDPGDHRHPRLRDQPYLFFATRNGPGQEDPFTEYDSSLRTGLIAINLRDGDELVRVIPTNGVLLVSSSGVLIRMRVDSISLQGAYATGVKVMALAESDRVAAVAPVLVSDEDLAADDEAAGDEVAASGAAPADEIVGDEAVDHADLDDADDAFDVDDTDEPPLA